jgi:SAM-dependent methyltransferase
VGPALLGNICQVQLEGNTDEVKNWFEEASCAICRESPTKDFQIGAYHLNLAPPLACKRCLKCGLVFLSPRPSSAIRRMLMEGTVPGCLQAYGKSTPSYTNVSEHRAEFFGARAEELQQLVENVADTGAISLLDIGASSGSFLEWASRFGWKYTGIEPSVAGARHGNAAGWVCPRAVAEHLPFCDLVFDLVHAHHVFEHFEDPLLAAREVFRVLKPEGFVYIEVPNQLQNAMFIRDSIFRRAHQRKRNLRSIHHLWFFSRSTMRRLLEAAGFRQVQIRDSYSWPPRGWRIPFSILTRLIGVVVGGGDIVRAIAQK